MNKKIGYLYLTLVFFLWGSLYVASKYAFDTVSPITLLLFRYLISGIALFFLARKVGFKRIKREHIKYFIGIGVLGYFASNWLQFVGTNLLDASVASLINSTNPIMISVLAAVLLKEKITARKVLSIAVSILGVYVILGGSGGTVSAAGVLISLISVLLWCLTTILVRKICDEYDPILITFYGIVIGALCALPIVAFEWPHQTGSFSLSAVVAILYIGIACTAVAHTLWNKSLSLLDASTCSLLFPIQPLSSALLGIVLLHEQMTLNFILGGILILAGLLIVLLKTKDDDKPYKTPSERRTETAKSEGKS